MKLDSINNANLKEAVISMQVDRRFNYYGYFSLYFDFVESADLPAAAGVTIKNKRLKFYYNCEQIDKMVDTHGKEWLKFLVIHECQHILLMHVTRTQDRHQMLSNIAQDMIINSGIERDFGLSYPEFFYVDREYETPIKYNPKKYDGKIIFEPLYDFILDETGGECDEDGDGQGGNGQGGAGNGKPDPNGKGKKRGQLVDDHAAGQEEGENGDGQLSESDIAQMQGIVRDIHESLKARGYNSGKVIEDNFEIKRGKSLVNVFKKVFGKGMDKESTYRKLSRRCPGLKGNKKESREINLVLDTSGSLYNDLNEYMGMVVGKYSIYAIQIDTRIAWEGKVATMADWKKVKKAGGGGTTLQPAIDRLVELNRDNMPLVFVSDFYCEHLDLSRYKGHITFVKTVGSTEPKFQGSKRVKIVSAEPRS